MLSVNMLQPYYVKEEEKHVRVVLAFQYFSLWLDEQIYQFVPVEAREIRVNRKTLVVENKNDIFVFQKGKKFASVSLADLLKLDDFHSRLQSIIYPYVKSDKNVIEIDEVNDIIIALEKQNVKRLIDQALDANDHDKFIKYTSVLNEM
ncbi:IDEAL domain-containing protein [Paraliobacillus sediminis]|uniref:IDEAL domain-containing protein n=1 Tax=Paraliobacillus sediminis TaxID=1885916 RepID=UPI000E3CB078|nr:IDEAL domain-containing protein [Paraliobacillus sediminis]